MSKVLPATCENTEVTCEDLIIEDAEILSEGVGSSSGIVIIDEDKSTYIAKTSPDLKTTLDKLITALDNIASALSSLDGAGFLTGVTGGGGSPAIGIPGTPLATADISAITQAKTDLNTLKGVLK